MIPPPVGFTPRVAKGSPDKMIRDPRMFVTMMSAWMAEGEPPTIIADDQATRRLTHHDRRSNTSNKWCPSH